MELTYDVTSAPPPTWMVVELTKPAPFTVRLREVTPAVTADGLMEVTDGLELLEPVPVPVPVVVPVELEEPPHPVRHIDRPRQRKRAETIGIFMGTVSVLLGLSSCNRNSMNLW